jgi:hypothetical protein
VTAIAALAAALLGTWLVQRLLDGSQPADLLRT